MSNIQNRRLYFANLLILPLFFSVLLSESNMTHMKRNWTSISYKSVSNQQAITIENTEMTRRKDAENQ